jgi:hypothetical protein
MGDTPHHFLKMNYILVVLFKTLEKKYLSRLFPTFAGDLLGEWEFTSLGGKYLGSGTLANLFGTRL